MKRYWKWAVSQWDRVIGWTSVGGGALLTLSGALNVSRARDQLDQLSYLASGPALGLFLLGVGAILILSADLRDEWGKLDEVASLLRQSSPGEISLTETAPDTPSAPAPAPAPAPASASAPAPAPANGATDVVALRAGFPVLAVAGAGIIGGASGVNQSLNRASALRWTQLSGASLILTLLVVGFLYLRGRGAVARGVGRVVGAVATSSSRAIRPSGAAGVPAGEWLVVEGSQRYHAAGCDLLRFAEVRPVPADEAAAAGLTRCPMCR